MTLKRLSKNIFSGVRVLQGTSSQSTISPGYEFSEYEFSRVRILFEHINLDQSEMEKKVEQLEAMFQKAESDINNLSQKLKCEFDNNEEMEVNPVRMKDKITDVKREYSALVQEAAAIQEFQKEAVSEFKEQITNVCVLLQKLQNAEIMGVGEKPEELKKLEELVGMSVPWDTPPAAPDVDTLSMTPPAPQSVDSGLGMEVNPTDCSACAIEDSQLSPATRRKSSGEFLEITQSEFESVSSLIRGRVKLSEVNSTYRLLWESHNSKKDSKVYTAEDMYKMGLKVSGVTGQAKLKVLRALKLLKLTSKGDVIMLV